MRLATRFAPDVLIGDALLIGSAEAVTLARVVVLTEEGEVEALRRHVRDLLAAGVSGVVSRRDEVNALFEAVQTVAGGEVWVSPRIAARLLPAAADAAADAGLTPRQQEILRRVARGESSEKIGEELGVAPGTLRNQLSAIYARIQVHTRAEAVAWGWQHGFVPPGAAPDRST